MNYGGNSLVSKRVYKTVDEYIAAYPKKIQYILEELRQVIREAAPKAEETISYQIPAFKLNGNLVWFAAFKNHIGFYPTASGIEAFKEKLVDYDVSKGTVRLPLNKSIPYDLIREIVRFRVQENLSKKKA
ncbi:MAG TPA: DUF1801 domain-containing protein [Candidatus Sulfotelmatobacter sp.]|nr:DUF1801 domain-containing protein [Candidatus Sulfotelmatobacter sp.]